MPAFRWCPTIEVRGRTVDLEVDLPAAQPLGPLLPELVAAAGLPADAVLHLGALAVDPAWTIGLPPLVDGVLLADVPAADLPVVGAMRVTCVAGPDAGRSVVLDGPVRVGRGPGNDLSLDDPHLSRRHLEIRPGPEGVLLLPASADDRPVLHLDGAPVDVPARWPPGAVLRAGSSRLSVTLDHDGDPTGRPDGRAGIEIVGTATVPAEPAVPPLPPPPGPAPELRRRPLPLVAAVGGAVLGAVIAAVTGMWMFLLLAALGPALLLLGAVADRITGRRGYRRARLDHRADTLAEAAVLAGALADDRRRSWRYHDDPATLLRRAETGSFRLWEQRAGPRVVIGTGRRPALIDRHTPPEVDEVPITVAMAGTLGIVGAGAGVESLLRWLLLQLVTRYSPADLAVELGPGDPCLRSLAPVPHLGTGDGTPYRVVVRRGRPDDPARRPPGPGLTTVLPAADRLLLPEPCDLVLEVAGTRVRVHGPDGTAAWCDLTGIGSGLLTRAGRALAPLRLRTGTGSGGLPAAVHRRDLAPWPTDPATVRTGWRTPGRTAVLGAAPGATAVLDLAADGPHLLVAGTTGAGKSELLLTLVAGLAVSAPPAETSFLLVDYKGGAAFGPLAALPHTVGVITDLDEHAAARALTGLRAELRRRERILAEHSVPDLAALGRIRPPGVGVPAALVVVVDEFATLAAELPDFLDGLVDLARRGRALGIHLVLATQRPAGVVSAAIRANITTRICLRVGETADSLDVLGSADAAAIPLGLPGRAYLRRGPERPRPVQTARITGHRPVRATVRRSGMPVPAGESSGPRDVDDLVRTLSAAAQGLPAPHRPWLPPLPAVLTAAPGDHRLAVADLPESAEQRDVPLPSGSVLVTGPNRSGRSSTLRRLAHLHAAKGAQLLLVDPTGGLRPLVDWPHTATHLDGRDPVLVGVLIRRLHREWTGRAAGGDGSPLVLVLDGWETITAALDLADFGTGSGQLAEMVAGGGPVGLHVVASGGERAVHHRSARSFDTVLELADPAVDGPGRGRIGGMSTAVLLGPDTPPPGRPVGGAVVVRPLPTSLGWAERPAAPPGLAVIGPGGEDAGPVGLPVPGPGGGILVAGPRRSGVSTALAALALALASQGVPSRRVRGTDPAAEHRFLTDHTGPLLLVHDGPVPDGPLAELLLRYLEICGPGQYLAIGCRPEQAQRALRGLLAEVRAHRTGLLLQPTPADGSLLDTTLPRRSAEPRPGQGFWVLDGSAVPVQVAVPDGRPDISPAARG
ncbi:hypothetical protein GIS00_03370 [Nakamurella sp. YIM 132087]|uniref:FHA domain-containing protein n=1 Tax=Nakamurella alba TaxID=2665158 RepID=A0A7K1FFU0_9ACTN|nr:FtsK/SpoIIIE domain-containing protein [Nakamurella alba]MTD12985.1 hypothetical protein [Nakamurella alba]